LGKSEYKEKRKERSITMEKRTLIAVYIVSVLLAIIIGHILSGILIENFTGSEFPFEIPPEHLPALNYMIYLKTVVSSVNFTLIILLLGIYGDLYRKIKTNFTAGLLLLIIVLLMNALTSNPLVFLRLGFPVFGIGIGFILPDILTAIALTVLFYLSLE
jgi:MFS family permease